MKDPAKDQHCRELYDALLPNLADYVAHWARERPDAPAIIEHATGETVTWKRFDTAVSAFGARLLAAGLRKGDVVATSLPLLKEHVFLMFACYRIGLVVAPLDLRLKAKEVQYCFDRIKPAAYFFLGQTPVADFRPLVQEVMASSPYVRHWVQFQKEPEQVIKGAVGITVFAATIKRSYLASLLSGSVRRAHRAVDRRDACLLIFTTGSTGSPKPAVLCHENILVQNVGLAVGFAMDAADRMLVNLPPSHVGCATEQLATTVFGGGTCVLLPIFDARASLEAIAKHRVTVLGQIPALFNLEWRLPEYASFDLSSLRFAIYGGQAVSRQFLERMRTMAPRIGTGLGLTETAGFCTYTDLDAGVDELAAGIGFDMPLCPISIREPMRADGRAGARKSAGEVGEICFSGPQVFVGYLDDPAATARALSRDGVLYTGDMGSYDAGGLHFAGRKSLVIKPKGYQVFPGEVEDFITEKLKDQVETVGVVGMPHEVFSEAIIVFVEKKKGKNITVDEINKACQELAAYKRPLHVVILDYTEMPLNRVEKQDYQALKNIAKVEVDKLRAAGKWDKE